MELTLKRKDFLPNRTFGELSIGDDFIGHILEDTVRDDNSFVLGETAIPYGKYRLIVSYSNRFKKQMVQIVNVRGQYITFHGIPIDACGIRIHGGNTEDDSLGCPLLCKERDLDKKIFDCKDVNEFLIDLVKSADANEEVYLNIIK